MYSAIKEHTSTEISLIEIYKDVLDLSTEQIDYQVSFVQLGGDSLDYIKLTDSILNKFYIENPKSLINEMNQIYYDLTVSNLGKLIDEHKD